MKLHLATETYFKALFAALDNAYETAINMGDDDVEVRDFFATYFPNFDINLAMHDCKHIAEYVKSVWEWSGEGYSVWLNPHMDKWVKYCLEVFSSMSKDMADEPMLELANKARKAVGQTAMFSLEELESAMKRVNDNLDQILALEDLLNQVASKR